MPTDVTLDTQIWTNIDYAKPGKQIGFLGVPQSDNSAGLGHPLSPHRRHQAWNRPHGTALWGQPRR